VDLCVNVLVRPTRISPRQSGAARPCSRARNSSQHGGAAGAGGAAEGGGAELRLLCIGVPVLALALFLCCFAMVAMLGWALSQLATLQDSVEEQGERPGQCLEAMLPSGA
jgi:hypothetical protein